MHLAGPESLAPLSAHVTACHLMPYPTSLPAALCPWPILLNSCVCLPYHRSSIPWIELLVVPPSRWALACAEKLGYSRYYKSLSSSVMRDLRRKNDDD